MVTMNNIQPIFSTEQYQYFIEELKSIITEGVFDANMRLIETYHQFGTRIVEETENFNRAKIYGESITKKIAQDIGKSQRTIQKCVQFALKEPDLEKFLARIPEGKSVTWNKICNTYLVEPKMLPEPEPIPNFSVSNIEDILKENSEFLVKSAQITKDGIHFFLPMEFVKRPS